VDRQELCLDFIRFSKVPGKKEQDVSKRKAKNRLK
jgi:hypothetical protein